MRTAIVGCGYLGCELARQLIDRGHEVVGVRRSAEGLDAIAATGADAIRADATDRESLTAVPPVDTVVYAASAGRSGDRRRTYVDGLRTVAEVFAGEASPADHLVYTSSTGVYGDRGGAAVDETTTLDPQTERERVLVDAESTAVEAPLPTTVARLGGIYGPDRYRIDRYVGRPVVDTHLNHVHVADAAAAIRHLLGKRPRHDIVTVVDDEPVRKPEFGRWLATELGADPPTVRTTAEVRADDSLEDARKRRLLADKRCKNDRLHGLGYDFTYPTYREGYAEAVRAWAPNRRTDGDAQ